MIEIFSHPAAWISLLTLTAMEIVLGIDNIVFISIVCGKLPEQLQGKARRLGIFLALFVRIVLLLFISVIIGWVKPIVSIFGLDFSARDLILLGGGLFLIVKSTLEIHSSLEGDHEKEGINKKKQAFWNVVMQVVLVDIVFSFDSVITAVGLADHVEIMIVAVVISMIIMLISAKSISNFIHRRPTIKILALSFLLMIGLLLVTEAFHVEVPKGYAYFAMAFSICVELLNMRLRKKSNPVELRDRYEGNT